MSIVIIGYLRIDPAKAEQAKAAILPMMQATRAEPGCHFYNVAADLEDNAAFHVCEAWESDAALASHMKTPHMLEFKAALGGLGVQTLDVRRYDAGDAVPLDVLLWSQR